MARRHILVSYCLMIIALAFAAKSSSAQIASTADLGLQQRATLERWLDSKPMLKLATETDCRNREGLKASREEYGRNYQPYYAIGDFNRDGQPDFAVALVNPQKRSRKFAIAVFNGPFGQRRASAPAFFSEGIDLSDGGIVWARSRLVVGVFQSDDCAILRPSGRTYVMKSCL
jgi:hypothetical protein